MNYPLTKILADELLDQGRDRFGLSMGIVSHIEGSDYEIFAVSSLAGVFISGDVFSLKDTYCQQVVESKQTIALTEFDGVRGLQLHPLYETLPLESYISSPILLADGSVWGTINFSCMSFRDPFSEEDIAFIEQAAQQLADSLQSELGS